jgi:hypothetical protein
MNSEEGSIAVFCGNEKRQLRAKNRRWFLLKDNVARAFDHFEDDISSLVDENGQEITKESLPNIKHMVVTFLTAEQAKQKLLEKHTFFTKDPELISALQSMISGPRGPELCERSPVCEPARLKVANGWRVIGREADFYVEEYSLVKGVLRINLEPRFWSFFCEME